jgi:hypothetical protein
MVVNDDAGFLVKRGDLKSIVGTPPGASSLLQGARVRWTAGHLQVIGDVGPPQSLPENDATRKPKVSGRRHFLAIWLIIGSIIFRPGAYSAKNRSFAFTVESLPWIVLSRYSGERHPA